MENKMLSLKCRQLPCRHTAPAGSCSAYYVLARLALKALKNGIKYQQPQVPLLTMLLLLTLLCRVISLSNAVLQMYLSEE